ncbi:phosphatase PAP2 family protein [Glycomyces sp. NPDC046736]|uniref:phosphatase PAP2 family protein n=1 Tax=Glycomyces sp. NPDC046736 TaxID=3155615 RepID=UPI003411910F
MTTPNGFPRSRTALILAVAVPLAVLADAILIRVAGSGGPLWQGLDDAWNGFVGGSASGLLWQLAEFHNRLGGRAGLILFGLGVIALILLRRWRSAVFACAAVAAAAFMTDGIKQVAERARPEDLMVHTASWAFPSGHAARMAAFMVVIAVVAIPAARLRVWWPIAGVLVLAMMWARTWQHAHWLTDTIAGAALGWAAAMLAWKACDSILATERQWRTEPDEEAKADQR